MKNNFILIVFFVFFDGSRQGDRIKANSIKILETVTVGKRYTDFLVSLSP